MQSIIIDIVTVAVIGLFVVIAYKRGFIATILSLASFVLSSVIASILSRPIAAWIFSAFIQPGLTDYATTEIGKLPVGVDVSSALSGLFDKLPEYIKNYIEPGTIEQVAAIGENSPDALENIASGAIDTVLAPVIIALVSSLVFLILFIVLTIVFRLVAKMLTFVNSIPIVGTANRVLGAVAGLLQGLIIVSAAAILFDFIAGFAGGNLQGMLDGTYIFKYFTYINPL
ncbi:MAG: CvpA family protein [Oscillospiraceae bacterium]|nr:CvpA family protein [Oscillospiraceae bacterium]